MTGEEMEDEKIAEGKIIFKGTKDTVDFDLPFEPNAVWLDRRSDVYGKFYDSSRWPRNVLERQAYAANNTGDYTRAAVLYQRAIEAEYYVPLGDEDHDPDDYKDSVERGTVRIHLLLAELYLRSGEHARAVAELGIVEASPKKIRRAFRERVEVARSRIDLGKRNYQAIVDRLRKRRRGRNRMRRIEAYAVLAVAAHETGHDEIYEKASRTAEKNGVDISALTDLRED
ncbi:MAG: hypothetical protein IH848_04710 [Acidobacteria bacterium]|nr:hypothetical protein [Acidobacteriota bacterium]